MADPFFQKTLKDLVTGIRSHKKDTSAYISEAIAEIKNELKSTDPYVKAEAVRKITYLQMIGFNVSWATFPIIEVMSQSRFGHKRMGYLAANQVFDENTDVILLTTNLFKKEFTSLSTGPYEIGAAINCLANIATRELARDCLADVVTLTNHQRPYVRKKAVLAMYKLYVKYPAGLRLTFDKIKDRLDDNEMPVVSTAVNVICELANKNPKNYLPMAPRLFKLLTTSSNNWMLIKVVKLMSSLLTEEPRLARKLLDPLVSIIQNTTAKSLQYECIYALTQALPHSTREDGTEAKSAPRAIKLCSDCLKVFVADTDQNLKYLGLVGLCNLMRSSPRSILEHRDAILRCLDDEDTTIKVKALELLAGIVSKRSLVDLVNHLREHAKRADTSYRDEVIAKILSICSREKYSLVQDFAWYVSVLFELAVLPGHQHGEEVANQLVDVCLRVQDVRPFAVEHCLEFILCRHQSKGNAKEVIDQVLRAAAFLVGEYASVLTSIENDCSDSLDESNLDEDDAEDAFWIKGVDGEEMRSKWHGQQVCHMVIRTFLSRRACQLPPTVQASLLQSILKLFVHAASAEPSRQEEGEEEKEDELTLIVAELRCGLQHFVQSSDLEVQERACTLRTMFVEFGVLRPAGSKMENEFDPRVATGESSTDCVVQEVDRTGASAARASHHLLATMVAEEFHVVHPKAQRKVPPPEDLDLDASLNESSLEKLLAAPLSKLAHISKVQLLPDSFRPPPGPAFMDEPRNVDSDLQSHSVAERRSVSDHTTVSTEKTKQSYEDNSVFILGSRAAAPMDLAPLSRALGEGLEEVPSRIERKKRKSSRRSHGAAPTVDRKELLPAGFDANSSEDEKPKRHGKGHSKKKSPRKAVETDDVDLGCVDITTPLRSDEVLYVPTHRVAPEASSAAASVAQPLREHRKEKETDKERGKEKEKEKKRKEKKEKKDRTDEKEKSSKHESRSKKPSVLDHREHDLLAMDWPSVPPSASAPLPSSSSTSDVHLDARACHQLFKESNVLKMAYGAQCTGSGRTIVLQFEATNCSTSALDVALSIDAHPSFATSSTRCKLDRALAPESTGTLAVTLPVQTSLVQPLQLSGQLHVAHGSSSDVHAVNMKVTILAALTPLPIHVDDFYEQLQLSNASCARESVRLQCRHRAKKVFKALHQEALRMALVKDESPKAVGLAAQTVYGHRVFLLAKAMDQSDSPVVQFDVKVVGESNSQRIAAAICSALSELRL